MPHPARLAVAAPLFAVALLVGLAVIGPLRPAAAKDKAPPTGKVVEQTTAKHARAWSLYVPSQYSTKKSWPLVISSHGRGGSGKGEMRAWQGLANRHGFIVACPDMVTATNHRPAKSKLAPSTEDDEVLLEIHATITKHFRVNPRAVMVTGFSGGGNPSYHSGLRHPEVFTHICTRGGNFAPQQIPGNDAVIAAGRKHLRIYIFFGDKDHVLIVGDPDGTGQAFTAKAALEKNGYEHIEFERVEGMKHQSRPDKAAAWLGAYVDAHKKAFKAADQSDALIEKAQAARAKGKTKDAVKHALKARQIERKNKLSERSARVLDELEKAARARLDEAQALADAGDTKGALKRAAAIKRDCRGLEAAEAAAALEKAWKAAAKAAGK
ncbi:MAG: alpha/beta hydrolase-fold protein [Planctomycetota bacterium]|nr:alpha/beta hydrolase-fold protein [Planctomycetota bacterium]